MLTYYLLRRLRRRRNFALRVSACAGSDSGGARELALGHPETAQSTPAAKFGRLRLIVHVHIRLAGAPRSDADEAAKVYVSVGYRVSA